MSDAVMISIKPHWCKEIFFGGKNVELRYYTYIIALVIGVIAACTYIGILIYNTWKNSKRR